MSNPVLHIGDKNYSSWSMRPWLALKQSKLAFREIKILLDPDDGRYVMRERLAEVLRDFPSRRVSTEQGDLTQGLTVRLQLQRSGPRLSASGELDLGDSARFYPSDAAIERWRIDNELRIALEDALDAVPDLQSASAAWAPTRPSHIPATDPD